MNCGRLRWLATMTAVVSVLAGGAMGQDTVRVFILSGQSNMSGGVPTDDAPLPGPDEVWYDYSKPADLTNRTEHWVGLDGLRQPKVETTFGHDIQAAFPNRQIALMKVNQGATSIGYWLPGGDGNAELELRIQVVNERLDAQVAAGEIAAYEWGGFVWFQGENNAAPSATMSGGAQYAACLNQLGAWVRAQTGKADLPVVIIRIYDYPLTQAPYQTPPYYGPWGNLERVRTAHVEFAREDERAEWVDTDDLPIQPGQPHYYDEAYHEAGRRSAQAYLNIVNGTQRPQSPFVAAHAADGGVLLTWRYMRMATTHCRFLRRGYTYTVEYGLSPDNLEHRITGIDQNQYFVSGLSSGTDYWFRVTAVDGATEGTPSTSVSATPASGSLTDSLHVGFPRFVDADIRQLQLDPTLMSAQTPTGIAWEKLSGPGTVTFSDETILDPVVTFGIAGAYLLRLSVTVGGRTFVDSLPVWVRPMATQSSELGGSWAYLAVDTEDDTAASSFHTKNDTEAWWEMDLGAIAGTIDSIRIHNRMACTDRLKDFYVFVSDDPFVSKSVAETRAQEGVWEYFHEDTLTDASLTVPVGRSGRFVRVQLSGTNFLHLREVTAFFGSDIVAAPSVISSAQQAQEPLRIVQRTSGECLLALPAGEAHNVSVLVVDMAGRQIVTRCFNGVKGSVRLLSRDDVSGVRMVRVRSSDGMLMERVLGAR